MIKLSVIVPFYNVENYIEQCIRSLFEQDIPQEEFEVICVDDCSPDNSRLIVERLQNEYSSLRLLCNERNKKLGGARNTGLYAAKGKYVWYVDSDDFVIPNCFNYLINILEEQSLDFIIFGSVRYNNDSHAIMRVEDNLMSESSVVSGSELFFDERLPWVGQISACNKIYNRSFLLLNKLFFLEDIMYEDNDFSFRVAAYAKRCKFVNVKPYVYRLHQNSVTQRAVNAESLVFFEKVWIQLLKISEALINLDIRFGDVINSYIKNDVYCFFKNIKILDRNQRRRVVNTMSLKDWILILRILPLKKRLVFSIRIIKYSI